MSDILIKLTTILVEQLGVERHQVKPEARLDEDLGADSLDCVEIIMALEEEWGIVISDEDSEKFITVGNIVGYLEEQEAA